MSCNTRRCRKAPSLAAASNKRGAKAPSTIFAALAMRPGATAVTSAAARPMLQLARKVFDDSIIVRPWRKPATRWLASVSDALRRNPATGIAGCCALREQPRRRAAEQRHELAASHSPMPPVLPTESIAHLGTADCCIHPPGRNEMIEITPPKIFPKEVAQNRPPHFLASNLSHHQKSF